MLILSVIAVLVVILVVVIVTRPEDFSITRSATMLVTPQAVFPQVNDLHNWEAWSPWAKLDPNMKMTFTGPEAGTGAAYTWTGNSKVGEGRMTIVESRPSELVRIKLEFVKPFTATNASEFTFQPQGNQTTVTWSMTGKTVLIRVDPRKSAVSFCLSDHGDHPMTRDVGDSRPLPFPFPVFSILHSPLGGTCARLTCCPLCS